MAILDPTPCNDKDFANANDHGLDVLQEVSDALKPGELVGALLEFEVEDGLAFYRVTNDNPLTVQFVAVDEFDGCKLSKAHIRGLEAEDVLEQLAESGGKRDG